MRASIATSLDVVLGGSSSIASLDQSGPFEVTRRQARYGLFHLGALSAHAGYGLSETPPDSDILAVDCSLEAEALPIRIQVKCTTRSFSKKLRYLSWKVEDSWRERWQKNVTPVYFVVVRVSQSNVDSWMAHQQDSTLHRAAAFWAEIDPANIPDRIRVFESDRLTAATLVDWDRALTRRFSGVGEVA